MGYKEVIKELKRDSEENYSCEELKEALLLGVDMYNPSLKRYAFLYSEGGGVACYKLSPVDARVLAETAEEDKDNWSSFLGPGGEIYDSIDEFLDLYGNEQGWMTCKHFYKESEKKNLYNTVVHFRGVGSFECTKSSNE